MWHPAGDRKKYEECIPEPESPIIKLSKEKKPIKSSSVTGKTAQPAKVVRKEKKKKEEITMKKDKRKEDSGPGCNEKKPIPGKS